MARFGRLLRELRESKGMTLKSLAKRIGMRHSSISRYENGEQVPAFDVVQQICAALEVKIEYFADCTFELAKKKRGRGRPEKK